MKRIITGFMVCFLCVSFGFLSGCNTVRGAGKDISNGGRDIQRAAYDVSH